MTRRLTLTLCCAIVALWTSTLAAAQELTATVVGISDGDTITVLVDRQQLRIRLHGIDAPEKGQPYSDAAKRYLSAGTHKRTIRIVNKGKDRYGRTLAVLYLPTDAGDLDVNADMVNTGLAWSYRQFSKDYAANEDAARRDRRGLWQDPHPVPPWQWRKPAARKASAGLSGPRSGSIRLSKF
jgi:micrococcal nuclease